MLRGLVLRPAFVAALVMAASAPVAPPALAATAPDGAAPARLGYPVWSPRAAGAPALAAGPAAPASVVDQVPGILIVCKQLTAGVAAATSFTFTTPPGGPAIPAITVPANTTAAVCAPGVPAAPGSVAVTEAVPAGFTLQSVTGGTLAGATATAPIAPGQPTRLTFINAPTTPGGAALTVNMTASPPAATVGSPLTYTITVTNTSGATATGVTVTDPLPANVTLTAATASVGSCNGGPGSTTVTCSLGTLTAGGSATVTITVVPTPPAAGATLTNTVTATAAGLAAGTATTTTPVAGGPFPPGAPSLVGANLPVVPPPPLEFIPPPGPPPFPLAPPPGPPGAPRGPFREVPIIPEADSVFLLVSGLVVLGGLVALRGLRRRDD